MEWISLDEQLPPFDTDVLFLFDTTCQQVVGSIFSEYKFPVYSVNIGKNEYMVLGEDEPKPTHWQRLPSYKLNTTTTPNQFNYNLSFNSLETTKGYICPTCGQRVDIGVNTAKA